jgi:cytochrome b561
VAESIERAEFEHYSGVARFFHWLSVLVVFIMIGTGLVMVYRGKDLNIWDDLTNSLYATHKSLGLVLLALVALRLIYRLVHGAPADEPSLHFFHRFMSHVTHWSIYGLLIVLPLIGWYGVSLFPALNIFGGYSIPALASPDQALAKQVLWLHGLAAYLLILLVGMHIGAALYHHVIRGDNVLRRMLPGLRR